MRDTRETLWKDYDEVTEKLKVIDHDHPRYELLLEKQDKIRNEILKYDQFTMEASIKREQIAAENRRDIKRLIMEGGKIVITVGIAVWSIDKTFKFDEVATPTSTLGRTILLNPVQKLFKW